jgi:NAD kinase
MEIDKFVLVIRATRLQENIKRFNTKAQAAFFVKSRGQSFEDYELEDSNYQKARELVEHLIPKGVKLQVIDRTFLPNFVFGPKDVIITLGQDGLVVNTAKYLKEQLILAVNPDPERFDGILLPFLVKDLAQKINDLFSSKFKVKQITMGKVEMNDGQSLYAFNDFYIGARTHISSRYTLHYLNKAERQSSSGILVSTPAGSTGWMSSVFNMAKGVSKFKGYATDWGSTRLNWEEEKLLFVVREPFKSNWSGTDLVIGEVMPNLEIKIESHMAESGVVFSDGMESDYLEFNSGSTIKIKIAEKKTKLIVN